MQTHAKLTSSISLLASHRNNSDSSVSQSDHRNIREISVVAWRRGTRRSTIVVIRRYRSKASKIQIEKFSRSLHNATERNRNPPPARTVSTIAKFHRGCSNTGCINSREANSSVKAAPTQIERVAEFFKRSCPRLSLSLSVGFSERKPSEDLSSQTSNFV